MREKDAAAIAGKLTEFVFRTYYTYRDETRENGDIAVGSHAFGALTKIYFSEKPYTVNEMSVLMNMQTPQLSKLLTLLEKHGLISRSRPEDNRRSVLVSVTDEGKAYVENMLGIVSDRIAEVLEGKELNDTAAVRKAMDQLYTTLFVK